VAEEEAWREGIVSLLATGREAKDYQQRNGEADGHGEGGLTNENVLFFSRPTFFMKCSRAWRKNS
jgi:hypothetical protein